MNSRYLIINQSQSVIVASVRSLLPFATGTIRQNIGNRDDATVRMEVLPRNASTPTSAATTRAAPTCWTRLWRTLRGERPVDHIALVLKLSLSTNIVIVLTMTAVAITSHSLALLSAIVENMVDLFVQALLWYAGTRSGKKQDYAKYPAGTSRFEPVAIIVAASVMALVSVMFIQESISELIKGFVHDSAEQPKLSIQALVIGTIAIVAKIGLIFYSRWVLKRSFSAAVDAIHQDNFNDTVSNAFAICAYVIASAKPSLWYVDPIGAMVIFLFIMFAWGKMAKEQVMQLVGVCASEEFITEIKDLCARHHDNMTLDIVRAYHFGSKYLVEIEVVVPADMTVKNAHDIALQLQFKIEQHRDVERAFVHVDYQAREYDEHVVSREEDALLNYAGYTEDEAARSGIRSRNASERYVAVPTEDCDAKASDVELKSVAIVAGSAPTSPSTDFKELRSE
ncbi:TPA: hypothetical protein N0F65_009057 [Lagenidium giganteum]|uniref:Cation efflux protein cytoplasmic domain-containing protein n=1 Tax=Lagenidium giganteum TaxID=4803 RepID=A0AAV2YC54_9STRA|nr:TPA: hypothetical protein N0F65_009057 [Lagenidium giganteum]